MAQYVKAVVVHDPPRILDARLEEASGAYRVVTEWGDYLLDGGAIRRALVGGDVAGFADLVHMTHNSVFPYPSPAEIYEAERDLTWVDVALWEVSP